MVPTPLRSGEQSLQHDISTQFYPACSARRGRTIELRPRTNRRCRHVSVCRRLQDPSARTGWDRPAGLAPMRPCSTAPAGGGNGASMNLAGGGAEQLAKERTSTTRRMTPRSADRRLDDLQPPGSLLRARSSTIRRPSRDRTRCSTANTVSTTFAPSSSAVWGSAAP